MEIKIRENIKEYMQELKMWILETTNQNLEEMDEFFAARIGEYEEHMKIWENAYCKFAGLLPGECKRILDLGCGTGLELDKIWMRNVNMKVTGVDLCWSMLNKCKEKHRDKEFETVCMDYFQYDMGTEKWDAVISFESLHHFLPERKQALYCKIYQSLKENAVFILGDYIACCAEEEELLREVYLKKRRKSRIPEDVFVHFDIPLTLEHEKELLRDAGFSNIEVADSINGVILILAGK